MPLLPLRSRSGHMGRLGFLLILGVVAAAFVAQRIVS